MLQDALVHAGQDEGDKSVIFGHCQYMSIFVNVIRTYSDLRAPGGPAMCAMAKLRSVFHGGCGLHRCLLQAKDAVGL